MVTHKARPLARAEPHSARLRALCLCVLIRSLLFVTLVATPASADERTGLDVVTLCTRPGETQPAPTRCEKYFVETLQLLDARPPRTRHAACPPHWFGPEDAVILYLSEAGRFPQVLHVPAVKLIEGMLLKFFPCSSV